MVNKDGRWQTVRKPSKEPSTNVFGFKEDEAERQKASKPHTQIEIPPKFRPAVHPPPSFATFCETRISSSINK